MYPTEHNKYPFADRLEILLQFLDVGDRLSLARFIFISFGFDA
jgi:hypothetical protein